MSDEVCYYEPMSDLVKYPRTPHLPWSPGATSDDVYLNDTLNFVRKQVIVTEKMDGENTTMYRDFIHARSCDSGFHPSRAWVRALHGRVKHDIPDGWRICGENLYAKHSIGYDSLPSYFMVFSIWDENNDCLSWDDTVEFSFMLGLKTVPVLYRGEWDLEKIKACYQPSVHENVREGYVVRVDEPFHFADFGKSIAKFVRKNHVQSSEHWMYQEVVPNKLKEG